MDIYHALKKLVADYRLDALTLRCFDLVLKDRSTGCLALSALFDEGIDAGCEGDIPSILALHWLRLLTGRIGWMANPSKITIGSTTVEETGSDTPMAEMLIAHCTTARSILSGYGMRRGARQISCLFLNYYTEMDLCAILTVAQLSV